MSGISYVWLFLLLFSYPFAYKYYSIQRIYSKKAMGKRLVKTTFWEQLKSLLKNRYIYGAGLFIASSVGLIDSLCVPEWVNCLVLGLWICLTACFWKCLIDKREQKQKNR